MQVWRPSAGPRPRVAVLDDYLGTALECVDWTPVREFADVDVFDAPIPEDQLAERLHGFNVLCAMRERTPLRGKLLGELPNLRLIASTSTKNAAIDLDAATRRGVVVSGTRGLSHTTIELTWALILGVQRHTATNDKELRAGVWQSRLGESVHGKTLGVIGLGNIGTRVAAIAQSFGMNVIAWSQNLTDETAAAAGARRVSKAELLRAADVVTIHVRLSERTRGLIAAEELASMRSGAVLVNTSRGPVVDEVALVDSLRAGRIRAAALDVYDQEPLPVDHPFLGLSNVLLSPHMGYVTTDSMELFYGDTVDNIVAFHAGSPTRVMNPDVLARLD